jgi:hypothetical protein
LSVLLGLAEDVFERDKLTITAITCQKAIPLMLVMPTAIRAASAGARIVVCDGGGPTAPQVRPDAGLAEGGRGLQVIHALAAQWDSFRLPGARVVWCDLGQPLRAPAADAWAWLHRVLAACPLTDDTTRGLPAPPAPAGLR